MEILCRAVFVPLAVVLLFWRFTTARASAC